MDVVIASSSIDGGIGCWDLQTGAEQLRYKTCASPPHGLVSVGRRFLASSQLRDPSATSGHVLYWSWSKVYSLKHHTSSTLSQNHFFLCLLYLLLFSYYSLKQKLKAFPRNRLNRSLLTAKVVTLLVEVHPETSTFGR